MSSTIFHLPCVILAGGFGTRLQSVVSDVVKPMAPMGHKPFLHVLMDKLYKEGFMEFILALGHKAESAVQYFDAIELPYKVNYSFEIEPLGTGGAIKNAFSQISNNEVIVLNGDTFFDISVQQFIQDSHATNASFFVALKRSTDTTRFGNIVLNETNISAFNQPNEQSLLQNAGIYFVNREKFMQMAPEKTFSLEQDIFPSLIKENGLHGKCYDGYFIDIGIPEDYYLAQNDLSSFFVDKSWTLFLDRDGVINERIVGDYIKNVNEFQFTTRALEAIAQFSQLFGRIIVVTNQQGIGKGLMTESNLSDVHRYMRVEVEKAGGRIDAVYHAPQLSKENSLMRKPQPGMAIQAKNDFPEIDFHKSIMIGDSDSDITFGQTLGMITVKLNALETSKSNPTVKKNGLADCLELFEMKNIKND